MRTYILFLTIFLNSASLSAQSKEQISNYLYDLPINQSPEKIRKAIVANDNFKEDINNNTGNPKLANSTFEGSIIQPVLPKLGRIDSAKVYLSIGRIKSHEGYTGDMKWIRFEYFSIDTLYLHDLFDSACIELMLTSEVQKPTGHRTMNNEEVGTGTAFVYLNTSGKFRAISASKVKYSSGKHSFTINYSGSD